MCSVKAITILKATVKMNSVLYFQGHSLTLYMNRAQQILHSGSRSIWNPTTAER